MESNLSDQVDPCDKSFVVQLIGRTSLVDF